MNRDITVSKVTGFLLLICGVVVMVIGGFSEKPFVEMGGIIVLLGAISIFITLRILSLEQRISKLETTQVKS